VRFGRGHEAVRQAETFEFSADAEDLLQRLFLRNPAKRLGSQGAADIKRHPFFRSVDWGLLAIGAIRAPIVPGRGVHAAAQRDIHARGSQRMADGGLGVSEMGSALDADGPDATIPAHAHGAAGAGGGGASRAKTFPADMRESIEYFRGWDRALPYTQSEELVRLFAAMTVPRGAVAVLRAYNLLHPPRAANAYEPTLFAVAKELVGEAELRKALRHGQHDSAADCMAACCAIA
jgi:hypothetical protein